uniref:Uncharacterized protein LOC100375635 n=1 Tax=Saccoglossus kowalevskii TaxID=10224 RepID=A0ABM0MMQ0_SACKO|nr:PREDICTED: uncharacterized protein LOC100375635 [Saccoglossus kowalevskii]
MGGGNSPRSYSRSRSRSPVAKYRNGRYRHEHNDRKRSRNSRRSCSRSRSRSRSRSHEREISRYSRNARHDERYPEERISSRHYREHEKPGNHRHTHSADDSESDSSQHNTNDRSEYEVKYKEYEKSYYSRSGNRYGKHQNSHEDREFKKKQDDEKDAFMERRRHQRETICQTGVPEVWCPSPEKPEQDSDEFSPVEKGMDDSEDNDTDSEEERKHRRRKKSKKNKKKKSKKSKKKRKKKYATSDSDSDTSQESESEGMWVEAKRNKPGGEMIIGPLPEVSFETTSSRLDLGKDQKNFYSICCIGSSMVVFHYDHYPFLIQVQFIKLGNGLAVKFPRPRRKFPPARNTIKHDTNIYRKRSNDPVTTRSLSRIQTSGAKIYVYDMPAAFNEDILDCVHTKVRGECIHLQDGGFGKMLWTDNNISYHFTHQFALEPIIHHKLLNSTQRTLNASDADLFYLPYYAGLKCFCHDRYTPGVTAGDLNNKFWEYSLNLPFIKTKPHFMALGKIEREHCSSGCPLLRSAHSKHILYLMIEQEQRRRSRVAFKRDGHEDEVIVVPYPSYAHFTTEDAVPRFNVSRSILVLMCAGVRRTQSFRVKLRQDLQKEENATGRHRGVYFHTRECMEETSRKVIDFMQQSVFCLQPWGDSPTRKSFYDSVLSGCIPVRFLKDVIYPFEDRINYDEFSLFVDKNELETTNTSIVDYLAKVPKERIEKMQDKLRQVAHLLQYGFYGDKGGDDALSMALYEIMQRTTGKKSSFRYIDEY